MVAQERINVRETVGKKKQLEVKFIFNVLRTKEEMHWSFKNSEK